MEVVVQIVNAFIDGDSGGNPAGVVVDANMLTSAQKLAVAQQVGLSETAFVSASNAAAIKLEFFTPTRQIAHCGHATVVAISLLRQLGVISDGPSSKETIDGNRDILLKGDMAFMEQRAPRYSQLVLGSVACTRALSSLAIRAEQLIEGLMPCIVNTGNSFLIIPLNEETAVRGLEPEFGAVEKLSEELDLIGYYAFSRATKIGGRVAGARMFAPRFGIREEAGTGMAAGPLACFLHDFLGVKERRLLIEQGWLMPSPSPSVIAVDLEITEGRIVRIMAGGKAKAVRSMMISV